eukprot:13912.XXX_398943_397867_1 [CDS] Oithona nana genome sequencing.
MRDKFNDIVLSNTSQDTSSCQRLYIFFGGDVQNFEKEMVAHRDHGSYRNYSLENVAQKLSKTAPEGAVAMCIRANRIERSTFSCYDHFVNSNLCGAPDHDRGSSLQAAKHLTRLLQNMDKHLSEPLSCLPKTLIGFSKGVVVLNQLLLDWHQLQKMETEHEHLLQFYKSIHTWIWLDGGHNGGQDTWMTSEGPLNTFVNNSEWNIQIKVTPRQVNDPMRPWIGKEEKKFRSVLKRLLEDRNESSRLKRTLVFADEEPSILNHFRVIDTL